MKDPAILFYAKDFFLGTIELTDAQVGKYMRLLCLQHENGHLTEATMRKYCKPADAKIFSKFVRDEQGCYFNRRLENETNRRKQFCESRRKSVSKRYNNSTYVEHTYNITATTTENEISNKDIEEKNNLETGNENGNLKVENGITAPLSMPVKEIMDFCRRFPEVSRMREPLNPDQAQLLLDAHPLADIKEVLQDMENYTGMAKKYKSAYLTCSAWLRRRNIPAIAGVRTIINKRPTDPGAAMVVHGKNFWRD
jgi:hypothetical protein